MNTNERSKNVTKFETYESAVDTAMDRPSKLQIENNTDQEEAITKEKKQKQSKKGSHTFLDLPKQTFCDDFIDCKLSIFYCYKVISIEHICLRSKFRRLI